MLGLLKAGFNVVAVVRDPSDPTKTDFLKYEASKLGKQENLTFSAGDLYKEGSFDEAFSNCDGVLHTAAIVEVGTVSDPQGQIVRPSVEGTKNVLSSVKKNMNTIKRYVHFSSVAAVQSLEKPLDHLFVDSDWNTWSTVKNGDPYGFAKTAAEKLVWDDGDIKNSSIEVVVLNPSIVLGPCLCKAHTKSSTSLIRQVIYGNPMMNYNGSFADVRDVALAATKSFQNQDAAGKRFIICGTDPSSTLALNDHVKKCHPWVKGSPPAVSSTMFNVLSFVGQLPLVSQWGINEFQKAMCERLIKFDATLSKEVLGIQYTHMEETCRDSVDSMKPFLNVKSWGGK